MGRSTGDHGRVLGQERSGRRGRGEPALPGCDGAAGPAEAYQGGSDEPGVRLRVRRLGNVSRCIAACRSGQRADEPA